jgi:hypothetical protein
MKTLPNDWGNPGKDSNLEDWVKYNGAIYFLDKNLISKIDLILIDGRFRVACCLKCFDVINNDCFIAVDDFFKRPEYNILLEFFDIVEKTQDNNMVILKKKNNINIVPKDIIKKYELDES